jgi:ariadne-1
MRLGLEDNDLADEVQGVLPPVIACDDDQKPAARNVKELYEKDNDQKIAEKKRPFFGKFLGASGSILRRKYKSHSTLMDVAQVSSTKEETAGPTNRNDDMPSNCVICCDDGFSPDEMMSMESGHAFCLNCWYKFIQSMLQKGGIEALRTTCPIPDCQVIVTANDIERVAPDLVSTYEKLEMDSFVQAHANCLRHCPGPDCTWVAIIPRRGLFEDANVWNYCCDHCRTRFCFHCGRPPHDGPCDNVVASAAVDSLVASLAETYVDVAHRLDNHPKPAEIDDKILKQCPKCGIEIQKMGGCNRMHCTACGHYFCWLCLGDFLAHGRHFCGKDDLQTRTLELIIEKTMVESLFFARALAYATHHQKDSGLVDEANSILQKLRYMDRYAHFYNRYFNHHQSQQFAENQCPCLSIAEENYCKMADIRFGEDSSFIRQANEVLVASRRLLKYTYCAAFYSRRLDDLDTDNFHLGFLHLEKLERFTEELSEVNENALTRKERSRVLDLVRHCERVPADAPE